MPTRGLLIALLFLTASPQTQRRMPIHVVSLPYPSIGRAARIQGDVMLIAEISSDGSVSIPIRKSGHPILLQAAEDNLKKWKFQSGEDQQMEITYHFKLGELSSSPECVFDLPNSVTITAPPLPVETLYSSPKAEPPLK